MSEMLIAKPIEQIRYNIIPAKAFQGFPKFYFYIYHTFSYTKDTHKVPKRLYYFLSSAYLL